MATLISFLKTKALYYGIARYTLSFFMMSFGLMKMLGMQFHVNVPFSAYGQPLERLTGQHLTWAFLGYSPIFQALLGTLEFVPAVMLLFRRTAFVGSLLLLPMTLCVFLINYTHHLWYNTQMLSIVLLLLNIILLALEWKRIKSLVSVSLDASTQHNYRLVEIVIALLLIAIPMQRKLFADYGRNDKNELTGDWFHSGPAEYILESETINDTAVAHECIRSYFGPHGMYSEVNERANNSNGYLKYSIDERAHIVHIPMVKYMPYQWRNSYYYITGDFRYQLQGDSALLLQELPGGTNSRTVVFKRRTINYHNQK
ncbi:MAG: hypothetical protein V4649_01855 [Bacteroidota bacterium]